MASQPRPAMETGYFLAQLARIRHGLLVLDIESTLGRLREAPRAYRYPSAHELLDCIAMTTATRVVLASGLPSRQLQHWRLPLGGEIWGRERVAELIKGAAGSPLAWLSGDPQRCSLEVSSERVWVRPKYYLGRMQGIAAPAEELVQFLLDWLRACAGEIC